MWLFALAWAIRWRWRTSDAFPDVAVAAATGHGIGLPQFRVVVVRAGADAARVRRLRAALAATGRQRP
jgi:hypothetical protein